MVKLFIFYFSDYLIILFSVFSLNKIRYRRITKLKTLYLIDSILLNTSSVIQCKQYYVNQNSKHKIIQIQVQKNKQQIWYSHETVTKIANQNQYLIWVGIFSVSCDLNMHSMKSQNRFAR